MGWIGIGAENLPREDLYFVYHIPLIYLRHVYIYVFVLPIGYFYRSPPVCQVSIALTRVSRTQRALNLADSGNARR